MVSVDLRAIFDAAEEVFSAKLRALRASVHHAGLKGAAVENIVAEFFRDILPDDVGVGTGVIIDSTGAASKQIDIILYDSAVTPGFLSYGGVSLYPIECVYFAIEVKTSLGVAEFDQCVGNMKSVKGLKARAYTFTNGPIFGTKNMWGREIRTWSPPYLIFALESKNFSGIEEKFRAHRAEGLAVDKQIDALYVVGGGTIANMSLPDQGVSLLPTLNSVLIVPEDRGIFIFIAIFSVYFSQVNIGASFNFSRYFGGDIGKTKVLIDPSELPGGWQA